MVRTSSLGGVGDGTGAQSSARGTWSTDLKGDTGGVRTVNVVTLDHTRMARNAPDNRVC
jgi:hypothetical protein